MQHRSNRELFPRAESRLPAAKASYPRYQEGRAVRRSAGRRRGVVCGGARKPGANGCGECGGCGNRTCRVWQGVIFRQGVILWMDRGVFLVYGADYQTLYIVMKSNFSCRPKKLNMIISPTLVSRFCYDWG